MRKNLEDFNGHQMKLEVQICFQRRLGIALVNVWVRLGLSGQVWVCSGYIGWDGAGFIPGLVWFMSGYGLGKAGFVWVFSGQVWVCSGYIGWDWAGFILVLVWVCFQAHAGLSLGFGLGFSGFGLVLLVKGPIYEQNQNKTRKTQTC